MALSVFILQKQTLFRVCHFTYHFAMFLLVLDTDVRPIVYVAITVTLLSTHHRRHLLIYDVTCRETSK